MITTLIYIIMFLIIAGVILWGVNQLLPMVPMDPRFRTVINVLITIVVVIVIVYVIAGLLGAAPPLSLR
jgi:preprotein translocase subunit SecE